jgi:hypothetical protein
VISRHHAGGLPYARSTVFFSQRHSDELTRIPSIPTRVIAADPQLNLRGTRLADFSNLALERKPVEEFHPQAGKKPYPRLERVVRLPKGSEPLGLRSLDRGWIVDAPMGGHWLAGPDRALLAGGFTADGEDEVQRRAAWLCELAPILAPQPFDRFSKLLENSQGQWMTSPFG